MYILTSHWTGDKVMHVRDLYVLCFLGRDADLLPQGPRQNQTQTRPCRAAVEKGQGVWDPSAVEASGSHRQAFPLPLSQGHLLGGAMTGWMGSVQPMNQGS